MRNVTEEEVRAAVTEGGERRIPDHACGFCGIEVVWLITADGVVYFDPSCECVRGGSGPEPRTIEDIRAYINMQTNPEAFGAICQKFGVTP